MMFVGPGSFNCERHGYGFSLYLIYPLTTKNDRSEISKVEDIATEVQARCIELDGRECDIYCGIKELKAELDRLKQITPS